MADPTSGLIGLLGGGGKRLREEDYITPFDSTPFDQAQKSVRNVSAGRRTQASRGLQGHLRSRGLYNIPGVASSIEGRSQDVFNQQSDTQVANIDMQRAQAQAQWKERSSQLRLDIDRWNIARDDKEKEEAGEAIGQALKFLLLL